MSDPQAQPAASEPSPRQSVRGSEHGLQGMVSDASTLASTGLILAVLFSILGGIIGAFSDHGLSDLATSGARVRLLNLTDTVDVGDVALLGIAVALLLLTPDPPGGINRPTLLRGVAVLAGVVTVFGIIRSLVIISGDIDGTLRASGFVSTVGVAFAAATVAYYAARESFLKKAGRI